MLIEQIGLIVDTISLLLDLKEILPTDEPVGGFVIAGFFTKKKNHNNK